MSLRAAVQVVLDDLTEAQELSKLPAPTVLTEAIDSLRDGLIDHRAREEGPRLYSLVTDLFDTGLPTAALSEEQLKILSRLRSVLHEVTYGEAE